MLAIFTPIREAIATWWHQFTLQTKLLGAATLVVSLVMSGLTFWAINSIQQDARLNDTRFGRDLGLLLSANVAPLIAENNLTEVAQFSQRFYRNTSSVRYMLYADKEGQIFFGVPFWEPEVENSLTIQRTIQLPDNYAVDAEKPMVRQHQSPDGEVTSQRMANIWVFWQLALTLTQQVLFPAILPAMSPLPCSSQFGC
jgi:two-component system, OmpR family, sensor histidine kinase NblS